MSDLTCPSCGDGDTLTGASTKDGIEITCHACRHRWLRGERRCRGCGGSDTVAARSRMTANPRGNQLAVLGIREIILCPHCDRAVVAGLGTDRMAPEGYVPRFSRGLPDDEASSSARPSGAAGAGPRRAATRVSSGGGSSTRPDAGPAPEPTPTVRTAVQSFLQTTNDPAAATAMLLLGPSLGIATRVDRIDPGQASEALTAALDRSCGEGPSGRRLAVVSAMDDALTAWASRGWLPVETARAIELR